MEEEVYDDNETQSSAPINVEELMQELSQARYNNFLREQRERELYDESEDLRIAYEQQRQEIARLQVCFPPPAMS